jgi:tetratricopeptide (TPR) repeat protein
MFLEFIARELNQSRVLLICTYRDMELNRRHPLTVTLGDLARERLYERVLLRGLSETDIARFVEIAAGFTAPAELSATIQRHTEGNPLFVTEVIRDLVQSGELTEEKVSGRSSWSVRIPEGVREVIGRRLDRLSDRANEIFTIAAVVGREFTHEALRELADDTTDGQLLDVLDEALDEALDSKIIEELPGEIGRYQFTHALIQETLTGELSSARKVRIHARIAETLERLYGDTADEHAAELVPHFIEAELVLGSEKSVRYCTLAGEQALAMTAPHLALVHFEHALAAIGDGEMDARKARVVLGLGRAREYLAAGIPGHQAAFDTLNDAFEYYVSEGDIDTVAAIALEPVMAWQLRGTFKLLDSTLTLVDPTSAVAGRIQTRIAISSLSRGDVDGANAALDRAFEIAGKLEDPQVEIDALLGRAVVQTHGGSGTDIVAGLETLDRLLTLLQANPDPIAECMANGWYAGACSGLGRLNDALARAETGYEIASRLRYTIGTVLACITAINAVRAAGRWEELRIWQDRQLLAAPGFEPLDRPFDKAYLNPIDDAESLRESFAAIDVKYPYRSVQLLSRLGEAVQSNPGLGMENDLAQALEAGDEAFSTGLANPRWSRLVAITAGIVSVALRDKGEALEPYRSLASLNSLESGLSTDRVSGLLAVLLEDPDSAIGHFEDALTFCRDSGYLKELAWTCSDYAEMLLDRDATGDREKAIELQDEALAITQELGMRPLTERILARREILRA